MRICAYCSSPNNLTKEHLISDNLLKRNSEYSILLPQGEKFIKTEPTIKDVCNICNNELLSPLDTYLGDLYQLYFCNFTQYNQTLIFIYDYNKLVRSLLKVSYNTSRAAKSNPGKYSKYVNYILNGHPQPTYLAIFVLLVVPYKLKLGEEKSLHPSLNEVKSIAENREIPPDNYRVSNALHPTTALPKHVVDKLDIFTRINFRSFHFYLLLGSSQITSMQAWRQTIRDVQKLVILGQQLSHRNTKLRLCASKINAIDIQKEHFISNKKLYQKELKKLYKL